MCATREPYRQPCRLAHRAGIRQTAPGDVERLVVRSSAMRSSFSSHGARMVTQGMLGADHGAGFADAMKKQGTDVRYMDRAAYARWLKQNDDLNRNLAKDLGLLKR